MKPKYAFEVITGRNRKYIVFLDTDIPTKEHFKQCFLDGVEIISYKESKDGVYQIY